jgi:hypothetical protein
MYMGPTLTRTVLASFSIADYNQSDLSDLLCNSSRIIQEQIQIREEETEARDARDQMGMHKRLARDHHRED